MSRNIQGFTLIEVMIVVVIISILAVVAVPSYQEHVKKGKRSDGKAYLLDLVSRQERFYTQFSSYTDVLVAPSGCSGAACGLGLGNNTSPEEYYTASVTATPAGCSAAGPLCTGYTLTAAVNGWLDDDCITLTIDNAAIKGTSGPKSTDYCWR